MPLVVVALLSLVMGALAFFSQQLNLTRAVTTLPDEGLYWTVAQYQLAYHQLKQELRAVAAGEPVNDQELHRRVVVFASKTSILTKPSEIGSQLRRVVEYPEATERLQKLFARIEPVLEKPVFSQTDARQVLRDMATIADSDAVAMLANDVRQAEMLARDEDLKHLSHRMSWTWAGFALCWLALVLWLLYAIYSSRSLRSAAGDRQGAIEGMERAVVAKRKFLSMISHEVRSPLQSIVSAAEVLALQNVRVESVAAIRRIRLAVTALQAQLRDLLTIARDDSGEWAVRQAQTFDIGELINDVCAELEETAHAKALSFSVEVPDAPVVVVADPMRIAQVLRNLVANAVRYTDSGEVAVRLEAPVPDAGSSEHFSANETESLWVKFSVEDTGPGMSAQVLKRLRGTPVPFETSSDGSGIGLFVVLEVLHQLGGRVDVARAVGGHDIAERTVITVAIPVLRPSAGASPQDQQELKAETETETDFDPLNVLIVDDRPDVLTSLSEMTRRLGHACSVSTSAEQAQGHLSSTRFDTVLIDLEMPGKNGLALAADIRRDAGINAASMLILISAAENRHVGSDWPFDGFLQKPIDGKALQSLIGSRRPH